MICNDEPSATDNCRSHVPAALGLSAFKEYLAVMYYDVNWLASADTNNRSHDLAFPPGPGRP
jgi:hypothetical protein